MAENKNSTFLKIVLIIYAIVSLVYGIGFFFAPDFMVNLSGAEPVLPGWLRWPGGLEIALAIGAILVVAKPENQGIFVTTMAIGCLFIGIAMLWTWLTLEEAKVWFAAVPTIVSLLLSLLLWWSRQQAKAILYPKKE